MKYSLKYSGKFYLILMVGLMSQMICFGTHSSTVSIMIRPVALVNHDMILCKTYYHDNTPGAQSVAVDVRFGILLISAEGDFFQCETFHYIRDDWGKYGSDSIYDIYERIYESDTITKEEKQSLDRIIDIEGISIGLKEYYLNDLLSYSDFISKYKVKNGFIQRTVNNYSSLIEEPDTINVFFKYKNIVMLRNNNASDFFDGFEAGSCFNIPLYRPFMEEEFGFQYIDGVIIISDRNDLQDGRITHEVKPDETLYSLAKQYGVAVSDIKKWNHLESSSLQIGEKLEIYVHDNAAFEQKQEESNISSIQQDNEYTTWFLWISVIVNILIIAFCITKKWNQKRLS